MLGALLPVLLPGWREVRILGPLPSPWPAFHVPQVEWSRLPELVDKALALSIIALGQSVSIAKAMAARSGQRIDTNREFLGQGLSNPAGGFFSCYLSCGSLNRSVPNLEAGARTPLAGGLGTVAAAAGGGVGAAAGAHSAAGDRRAADAGGLDAAGLPRWRRLARLDRTDLAIAATTLAATLLLRLEIAILIGTGLSLVAYLYQTSRPAMRTMASTAAAPTAASSCATTRPARCPSARS